MVHRIPVLPGDGIGPEIIDEGKKVLDAAADTHDFSIEWKEYPYGADHYLDTGELMPDDALEELSQYDGIYLGSVGDPRVEPGVLEKGILLKARFYFDQYINLRPVKLLPGVQSPLRDKGPEDIDFVVVRENTEDFYVGIGGRAASGTSEKLLEVERSIYRAKFDLDIETDSEEIAYQVGMVSREGCERVIEYAFDLAEERGSGQVVGVDKANVLSDIYGLWREVMEEVAEGYPGIGYDFNFVDAVTMWFVKNPDFYDVVVTPNMFGDIITDLGAMLQGGLGLAPGGNINPNGTSMFEPIHGSAPKHAGKNRANPIATIWAGAMLLDHIGEEAAADDVVDAIGDVILEGETLTYDLGGDAGTSDVGDAVAERVRQG